MAELVTTERLQPALLDRLVDDEPKVNVESREKRVMSMRLLRQAVLRDLAWLMNSPRRIEGDEIYDYPAAARSVLNYGAPDLTGQTASGLRAVRVETQLREAIEMYEPRIVAGSLSVRIVPSDAGGRGLSLEIAGELCPLPMPEALFVRTEVDLETGQLEIRDRTG